MKSKVKSVLTRFFLINYICVVAFLAFFFPVVQDGNFLETIFSYFALFSQSIVYVLPAVLLSFLFLSPFFIIDKLSNCLKLFSFFVPVLFSSLTFVLLYADSFIYDLYGFHVNSFVWNLLKTPGGIESLGGTTSTFFSVFLRGSILLAYEIILYVVLWWLLGRDSRQRIRFSLRVVVLFIVFVTAGDRLIYGVSQIQAYTPVLQSAQHFPFYTPLTFRKLAKKMGFEVKKTAGVEVKSQSGLLEYPRSSLIVDSSVQPLNVLFITVESLRADMLSPEIMPHTDAFSRDSFRFLQHFSGGNATRMGIFSLFYGLPGPYWFKFIDQQKSPVLLDVLQDKGYEFGVFASQKLTYPEFDKTVFSTVPTARLQQNVKGRGYRRDEQTVAQLIRFLTDNADGDQPFFAYAFLESPHAPYTFSENNILKSDYLKDLNYLKMRLDKDLPLIKNRYINSCYHVDTLLGAVFEKLASLGLLTNTLVMITGDHGEEFLDTGRWGHNNAFTDAQTHVPMVLYLPDREPQEFSYLTSHVDIPATIMPILGVTNPPSDYSTGINMFGPDRREYVLVSDWSRVGYVDDEFKANFPMKAGSHLFDDAVTTRLDEPYPDSGFFYRSRQNRILAVMDELSRFSKATQ